MAKKYLAYHQYTITTNLYLKVRHSVSFLICILKDSAHPLIIASCQQDLTSIDSSVEQISNIIKKPDPNKAHGHDKISICLLKLCRDSINRPLATIFKNCFNERIFPNDCKKANVVPIHNKLMTCFPFSSLQ